MAEKDRDQLCAMAYARYQADLKASGAMDFDDLLLVTEELFDKHPDARYAESSSFDHLLVDEYQDTNNLQYKIVKSLGERHRNVCVVGDDDQSIYGWRGAEVAHILNFNKDWPEAKIIRLEENYRSRAPILQYANTLIAHNSARHGKVLRATREAVSSRACSASKTRWPRPRRWCARSSSASSGVKTGRRPRRASSPSCSARTSSRAPSRSSSGARRCPTRSWAACLSTIARRSATCSRTSRFSRTRATKSRCSGSSTRPRAGSARARSKPCCPSAVEQGVPLWNVLPEAIQNGDIQHATAERIELFRKLIEFYRARLGTEPIAPLVTELLQKVDYKSELDRVYKNAGEPEARWQSVEEFVNSVALYEERTEQPSLLGFLEEATLSGREDNRDSDDKRERHAITLMTMHSAKGLEFPHVYIVGMEEGILPHSRSIIDGRSIDEERRLAYVGVTRAQETLTLSFAKTRMKWGKPRGSIPSRFLMEMRGETERAKKAAEAAAVLFAQGTLGGGEEAEAKAIAKRGGKKKATRKRA